MLHRRTKRTLPHRERHGFVSTSDIFDYSCLEQVAQPEAGPDPSNFDAYFEWGRRRYGEEWYQKRKLMLSERNVYVFQDTRYKKRQEELRALEYAVDSRPSPTGTRGMARQQQRRQPRAPYSHPHPLSPLSRRDDSPDARSPHQLPYDTPNKGWTDSKSAYHKHILEAQEIACRRNRDEDAIGDQLYQQAIQELNAAREQVAQSPLARNSDAFARISNAYDRKYDRLRDLERGVHWEVVEQQYRQAEAAAQARYRAADELRQRGPQTQEELMTRLKQWQKNGLTLDEHDRLTQLHGLAPIQRPDYTLDDKMYNGYDYLSLCKRTPQSRPQPSEEEMRALAATWRDGLVLSELEIQELLAMYGYGSAALPQARPQSRASSKYSLRRGEVDDLLSSRPASWRLRVSGLRSGKCY